MKKLNLKLGGIKDMLTREQMKKVVGGYGSDPVSPCHIDCYYGSTYVGQINNIGTDNCPQDLSVATYYCHQVYANAVTVGYCSCN